MEKSLDTRPARRRAIPPAFDRTADRPRSAETNDSGAATELRALTEHLDLGVLLEDRQGRIRLANRQFCRLFGLSPAPEDVVGMPARTAARRAARQLREPEAFLDWTDRTWRRREAAPAQEWELRDGRVLALGYTPMAEGGLANLWQCRDVTEHRRAEDRLRALAQTDELTGLPNRRHVLDELEREMARYRRSGSTASVLMLDVDGFKQVNDARGHAAGDGVLCDLAAVLARRCRTADTAARLGGDEFLITLPDTGCDGCCDIAGRLVREVRAASEGAFTVSIGATTLGAADAGVDTVLARVDRALYAAKSRGRDCMQYVDADTAAETVSEREMAPGLRPAG